MKEYNSHKKMSGATKNDHQSSAKKKKKFPKKSLANKLLKKQVQKKKKNKFICDKCETRFATWWERRSHWLASGHKAPELCRWCGQKTYTLQSHLCMKHMETAIMCPHCGLMFMFQEDMNKHVLQHGESEYRCSHCGRQKKNELLLRTHVQDHFLNEKYGCNVCEKRFKKKKNLEKHLICVHFICKYCGHTSDSATDLMTHVKIHDNLKCVLCHKVFSQKNRLKYHYQLIHSHQDFYKCSACCQRFAKKSVLIDHIKLKHQGKSNFSCEICDIPFLYWQGYQNHFNKVHLKKLDNKFDCSFCEFSTTSKYKLKCHVEKSSGIGFFCKKCKLRLECKGRFDKHMQTHERVQSSLWCCDHCARVYLSDNSLRHHMAVYHPEEALAQNPNVHYCLFKGCDRFYASKSSLARHKRKVHLASDIVMNTSSPSASIASEDKEKSDSISEIDKKQEEEIKDQEKKIDGGEDIEDQGKITVKKEDSIKRQLTLKNNSKSSKQIKECLIEEDSNDTTEMLSDSNEVNVFNCRTCDKFWFSDEAQFIRHMKTHDEQVWQDKCYSCNIALESPERAVRHYVEEHLKVKFVE